MDARCCGCSRRVTLLSTTPDGGPADQSTGAPTPRKSSVLHDLGRKAATNFKNSVFKLPPQTLAVLELPAHMRTRAQVIELVTHLSVRSLCRRACGLHPLILVFLRL